MVTSFSIRLKWQPLQGWDGWSGLKRYVDSFWKFLTPFCAENMGWSFLHFSRILFTLLLPFNFLAYHTPTSPIKGLMERSIRQSISKTSTIMVRSMVANIQKTKIRGSGPITSWQIDGETMETVRHFIFGCSKITADGDCSHEIERRLLLGRKAMINLDSIWKSRDITLSTKVSLVKATVFPVVKYGCESWIIKKAECRRFDAFELWCWRRLESPLDCKEIQSVYPQGNQSWIFTGRTDAEAETPVLWPPDVKNWH